MCWKYKLNLTARIIGLLKENDTAPVITDPKFFLAPGKQYMLIAKEACPPESHARKEDSSTRSAEVLYKDDLGGFITNFNLSSDLCTVGPEVESKHGFLFAPSTVVASRKLLPIFGECKVNVNNDILFPVSRIRLFREEKERAKIERSFRPVTDLSRRQICIIKMTIDTPMIQLMIMIGMTKGTG